jgi:hypothetical protein
MSLFHSRQRRQLTLLAADALDGSEREQALAHVDTCAACRLELGELRGLFARLAADPARSAELPVAPALLSRRVLERLDEASEPRGWTLRWRFVLAPAVGVAAALALLALLPRFTPRPEPPAPTLVVSEAAFHRLERTLAREQAVRYLNDAQDVLVTVASTLPHCERHDRHVDVAAETERSRELLARRALLVDLGGDGVLSARPVLQDVEQVLRAVAALDPCAHPEALALIQADLQRRRLLMKIDLMTRELQG